MYSALALPRYKVRSKLIAYLAIAHPQYSILLLYHRIFSLSYSRFKWVCIGVGVAVFAYSLGFELALLFQCDPIESHWDASVDGTCSDLSAALLATSALNAATDVLVLALPVPLVWRMKASLARRIQILGVFLLGSFIVFVAVVRTAYVGAASLAPSRDSFWDNAQPIMWSTVEPGLAIVAACLPVMRPVLDRLLRLRSPDGAGGSRGGGVAVGGLLPLGNKPGSGGPAAHIVTIGGTRLRLEPGAPGPGGAPACFNSTAILGDDDKSYEHKMKSLNDSMV